MATVLFAAIGSSVGAGFGGTILGLSGAVIGQAVGGVLGRVVDSYLLAPSGGMVKQEGPRLDALEVMASQEGGALPEIAGRTAIGGTVIWAANLKETVNTSTAKVGSGKSAQSVESTTYSYSSSFAVSLGEGPLSHLGRLWFDGRAVDVSQMLLENRIRFYPGTETQDPDPLIEAIEGAAPAYRGTAYIVFEDLALEEFGNRVPQVIAEVFGRSGVMEGLVRGVNVIPGSTEWGYLPSPNPKIEIDGFGNTVQETPENTARYSKIADWTVSMDLLGHVLPNASTVSLVASWFGSDLRAGLCRITPKLEIKTKRTKTPWSAGGLTRETAEAVSTDDEGRPAFGSTPADLSIVRAIGDLRARGKRVVLYPFLLVDVTAAQALPDPSGTGTQGAYPWRGRIAPRAGASVVDEVAAFMGNASASDFAIAGETVTYSGAADDWGFRRFILHLAATAKAAGGVDAFLIGSEMRGLTMARHSDGSYPYVQALRALAAEVRALLPAAQISYAADWSEYHSDRPGSEVRFHLDPLWADGNIDFVGIDNYLPLSDWRHSETHADRDDAAGITSPYALDYLKGNIEGGEYWDWYYLDDADRAAQNRRPIQDLAYGEPWVYRQKAIRDWHGNAHHERDAAGVRSATATAWVPGSKPVWFTELGCPAVDLGANQPNVFSARLSSESALPYFSAGIRDDFMQRQFLRASFEWWAENGGAVLDVANVQVWCWDARPWPEFPNDSSQWTDVTNWRFGHWLNGRAGAAPVAEAITRRLTERHGLTADDFDVTACFGQADGYASDAPVSFRDYVQPFEVAIGTRAREVDGKLTFAVSQFAPEVPGVTVDDMIAAETDGVAPWTATRGAIEDTAAVVLFRFRDGLNDYQISAVRDEIGEGPEAGTAEAETPLILDFDRGIPAAARLLRSASSGREALSFTLPRSFRGTVRPGVILPVTLDDGAQRVIEVQKVTEGAALKIEGTSFDRTSVAGASDVFRGTREGVTIRSATSLLALLDLPQITADGDPADGYLAAYARPWPGRVTVARSYDGVSGFETAATVAAASTMGETVATLTPGDPWVWSAGPLDVKLYRGTLTTRGDLEVLGGANALAVQHPEGWEIVQFRDAELQPGGHYRLTGLLRGQRGTEALAALPLAVPARVVVLDATLTPAGITAATVGVPFWWRYGPPSVDTSDHLRTQAAFSGVGRRPFAPVHLSADWSGGDVALSWVRRTREIVGTWPASGQEPPIGETSEGYRVEIGPVGAPVRVAEVAAPAFSYTAAMRAADGVSLPVAVRVSQLSATFGPGPAVALTLGG